MKINGKPVKKSTTNDPKKKKNQLVQKLLRAGLIFLLVFYGLGLIFSFSAPTGEEKTLSEAMNLIKDGQAEKITVIDNRVQLELKDGGLVFAQKEAENGFTQTLIDAGIDPTTINLSIDNQNMSKMLMDALIGLAPIILTGALFWYIFKQAGRAQNSIFSFGKSKVKLFKKTTKATFDDVAGLYEAKEELKEAVDFLKNPTKYQKMGARTPKGVLLVGPSGTGKTLMARAVAGEAKVPFLHMAGSEFMEMLVGVGASRTRDLFSTARKTGKAIIFIDEIDAIGAVRGIGVAAGHSEREQTLNQLLVEMDGLEPNAAIIVIAATNRPDILDTALTRPGRFDRNIALTLPDLEERVAILKLHAKGKPFTKRVSWQQIAQKTVGFSGADLENMLNEAAILSARTNKKSIGPIELDEASIKVKLGPQKRRMITDDEKKMTAYHEAGHAIVSHFAPKSDPVARISIVSRGLALGYTLTPPERDRVSDDKTRLLSSIAVTMGGRVAEQMIFNEVSSGAASDIKMATMIARKMVIEYGMSELGPIYFGPQIGTTEWGKSYAQQEDISPRMMSRIDSQVKKIIDQGYQQAEVLIKKHRKQLDLVATELLKKETLERKEFEKLIK
ncbi:MAG: ATP-dependent zinc metalloprotease FtsH [Patescibacteria group bacterium]